MSESCILVVDQDPGLRQEVCALLAAHDRRVVAASCSVDALDIIGSEQVGLVFGELEESAKGVASAFREIRGRYPDIPAVALTRKGSIETAVDIMRGGAAGYLTKPVEAKQLTRAVEQNFRESAKVQEPVAVDRASQELYSIARRVAATEVTVSISGESGTGKEVLARYIHDCSPRKNGPFVAINCAAIPENMLEAMLFGYEKGAFTGAERAHPGKFEQANTGTILLDEISEMDLGLQAKLLRVLQEKEVERIGSRQAIPLSVRVVATTNRNLREWVAEGRFREDLYYRLNVLPLSVAALRDRRDDILPLAEMFLEKCDGEKFFGQCAREQLRQYDWPGNVRELDNLVQRTAILSNRNELLGYDLAFEACGEGADGIEESGLHREMAVHEFECIRKALVASGGKRGVAARELEISPRTLRYKLARMREIGIVVPGE